MRICFICETPYQIFNAINYAVNQKEYQNVMIDLYIGSLFKDAISIADRIKEKNVFSNVFLYSYKKENFISRFLFVAFPYYSVKHTIMNHVKVPDDLKYNKVFISTYSYFGMAMIMSNEQAEVCFYDDGLGSYTGKIGFNTITKKRKKGYKLMGMDYKHLFPKFFYINNVDAFNSDWDAEVKPLPSLCHMDPNFRSVMRYIFKDPIDEYHNIKIVLLTQPHSTMNEERTDGDDVTYNVLKEFEFIVRHHPLERNCRSVVENGVTDDSGALWELVCAENIDDDSVLIGMCSTAQASPKLLYDTEPYILFTHSLYTDVSEDEHKIYHDLCERIRCLYRKPEKVIEIVDENQLMLKLREIISR